MNEAQEAFLGEVRRLLGPPVYIKPEEVPFVEISDPDRLCQSPLVSVVCITYNHAKYIGKTFQGFEEQITNFPVEIIIGEDCSTDNTLELCKLFQSKHPEKVRVLTWEKNVGATTNLLRTERACRGKYIAYCEGDDFWCCPTKLQTQVDYLESHSECGLVHGNSHVFREGGGGHTGCFQAPIKEQAIKNSSSPVADMLRGKFTISTSTVVVRRDLMVDLAQRHSELYYRVRRLGDLTRWTGILSLADGYYTDQVLSSYVLSDESATRSSDSRRRLLFVCDNLDLDLELNNIFNNNDELVADEAINRNSNGMIYLSYKSSESKLLSTILALRSECSYVNALSSRVLTTCYMLHLPFFIAVNVLRCVNVLRRIVG